MSREPSLNDDAPEGSDFDDAVQEWIDAAPFPMTEFLEDKLRDMAEEAVQPDGDEGDDE